MFAYTVIPQSQATAVEFEFLKLVSDKARELAGNHAIANGVVSRRFDGVYIQAGAFVASVSLDGLRPAWLNTMAELCQYSADSNRHVSSQFSTIRSEIESCLYYYALGTLEMASASDHSQGEY